MTVQNNTRRLSFVIESYQYPHLRSSGRDYDYDANWLDVSIQYSDEEGTYQYLNPCLLTYELESLVDDIADVVSGEESLYISDFMEPYLKISAMRVDNTIMLGLGYVYDTTDGIWKEHKLAEQISFEQANRILDELKSFIERFPNR